MGLLLCPIEEARGLGRNASKARGRSWKWIRSLPMISPTLRLSLGTKQLIKLFISCQTIRRSYKVSSSTVWSRSVPTMAKAPPYSSKKKSNLTSPTWEIRVISRTTFQWWLTRKWGSWAKSDRVRCQLGARGAPSTRLWATRRLTWGRGLEKRERGWRTSFLSMLRKQGAKHTQSSYSETLNRIKCLRTTKG
jgi:hypothetical protein